MAQPPRVRAATTVDLLDIAQLSRLVQRSAPENDGATIARHLSAYLSAGGNIYLAVDADGSDRGNTGPVDGYVLCRQVEPLFYAVDRSVIMDAVFVAPARRRRGIGHALILAVANYAQEIGAGYIYATPSATDRALHRFLASLGLAPVGGYRVVATPVLMRKLLREDPITQGIAIRTKGRSPARTPIDEVIAKRKRARTSDIVPS